MAKQPEFLDRMMPVHRKFAECIANGLSNQEAAKQAGYPKPGVKTIDAWARRALQRDDVLRAIAYYQNGEEEGEEADLRRLGMEALRELIKEGMPPATRARAAETLFKLLGDLGPKRTVVHAPEQIVDERSQTFEGMFENILWGARTLLHKLHPEFRGPWLEYLASEEECPKKPTPIEDSQRINPDEDEL